VLNELSRRRLLTGAAAAGGAAAIAVPANAIAAVQGTENGAAQGPADGSAPVFGGTTILPGDPRYPDFVDSWNGRFAGTPDYVRVVGSTAQVETALAKAVSAGKRVAARSGGHCVENFWANSQIKAEIDLSSMTAIYFDPAVKAFVVEPGAVLRDVTKTLWRDYGVTLPGGICPDVGAGGHFCGGGYGVLARRDGVVPDHMYGVEVVTVDKSGTPRTVIATREAGDPNRDLFWAHTGGGGGNFGIVTRYWMRTPGTSGSPGSLLPKPPAQARMITYAWPYASLTLQSFTSIVKGYCLWHEANSAPGSPYDRLYALLWALHVNSSPDLTLTVVVDPAEPDSDKLLANFVADVINPVTPAAVVAADETYPWLQFTEALSEPDSGALVGWRTKAKGSYLRKSYTDAQIATIYHYLTATSLNSPLAGILFSGYGGQVNAVAPDATTVPQRDSVLKLIHTVYWEDAAQDATYLGWAREFYRDLYSTTGGVPTLNGITDGSYINYADVDLANPTWNTSGVPWSALYYKDNYARLQEVKATWDPLNIFHHALSVQAPG
jgi:hypothetical protein